MIISSVKGVTSRPFSLVKELNINMVSHFSDKRSRQAYKSFPYLKSAHISAGFCYVFVAQNTECRSAVVALVALRCVAFCFAKYNKPYTSAAKFRKIFIVVKFT